MDIKREVVSKPMWKRYWFVTPVVALLVVIGLLKMNLGNASYMVDKQKLQLATVEQGHFRVDIRGNGVLTPQDIRWMASLVSGRVEQLLVKPGAQVKVNQPLVVLSNPSLIHELDKAKWELKAAKANNKAEIVALESQLLDLETSVSEAEFNYKSTKLKLDAESELIAQNKGSISHLEYQRSQLAVEQQMQRWKAQQRRFIKMKTNFEAMKSAKQAQLEVVENNFQRIKTQIENLTVRATMHGVIQNMPLTLGEQVNIGANVAMVADPSSLIAELNIQELQINQVVVGQKVVIDTRNNEIAGTVTRIDPKVTAGMVQVDVALSGTLPIEARPDLNVEGRVEISNIENALFVKRPAFTQQFSKNAIYKLNSENKAEKIWVEMGQHSVNHIQILSGLTAGDTIIVTDTTDWQSHNEILIN